MEVSGQLHALAALPQGKCPWMGEPQSHSGRRGEEKIPSTRRESNPIIGSGWDGIRIPLNTKH
jgi:hypothetical protein